jgi:hypothetical protein
MNTDWLALVMEDIPHPCPVKVKLSLCLTNEAVLHEGVWGVDVQIHFCLTSALFGVEWSTSCHGRFTPGKEPLVPIG